MSSWAVDGLGASHRRQEPSSLRSGDAGARSHTAATSAGVLGRLVSSERGSSRSRERRRTRRRVGQPLLEVGHGGPLSTRRTPLNPFQLNDQPKAGRRCFQFQQRGTRSPPSVKGRRPPSASMTGTGPGGGRSTRSSKGGRDRGPGPGRRGEHRHHGLCSSFWLQSMRLPLPQVLGHVTPPASLGPLADLGQRPGEGLRLA